MTLPLDEQLSTLDLPALGKLIDSTMQQDRFRLRREYKRIKALKPTDRSSEVLQKFSESVVASSKQLEDRKECVPKLKFDTDLPIYERKDEIAKAIIENQVVVISGETGSGKSTQLPLIALEAGFGISGLIGHTQPRRIAARGVSARIASQLGSAQGTDVGFKIRFDDKTSDRTYVKLMTDGILLAETQTCLLYTSPSPRDRG